MSVVLEQSETASVLRLEGEIDIACSDELKRSLIDAIVLGKKLQIDFAGVGDLDVTAVQLLYAAVREAEKAGLEFGIRGAIPKEVLTATQAAGFESFPVPATPRSSPAERPSEK